MPQVPEKMKDDAGRRQALKKVEHATAALAKAERQQRVTIRYASELGVSLRDIGEAAGVSHMKVRDILNAGVD